MLYYTFNCETYEKKTVEIVVKAKTEKDAVNRLKDYEVNRGQLHYYHLKSVSETGEEKYFQKENNENALALLIALAGAAFGCVQIAQYGIDKKFTDCLKDDVTVYLIKH